MQMQLAFHSSVTISEVVIGYSLDSSRLHTYLNLVLTRTQISCLLVLQSKDRADTPGFTLALKRSRVSI